MLFYYDPRLLEHETGQHPERPARASIIARMVLKTGLESFFSRPQWQPASVPQLARWHDPSYVEHVERFCSAGGGPIEADTVCSRHSYEVACLAAGSVCDAVTRVLNNEDRQAFCAIRPPGHHALRDSAMGFCLFGNITIGALVALEQFGLNRVLIVDWDVHHGNGTQDAFWRDERAGFLSIHRWPFYPGTGTQDETGAGPALGTKLNLPIEFGTPRRQYLDQFRSGLEQLAARVRPELVLISAGFDAHREDPVGSLELESEDFVPLTEAVLDIADAYAGGRVVSVLEGGYNLGALAESVEVHLETLLARAKRNQG